MRGYFIWQIFAMGTLFLTTLSSPVESMESKRDPFQIYRVGRVDDISKVFPTSVEQIEGRVSLSKGRFYELLSEIAAIDPAEREFGNTILALDRALGLIMIEGGFCQALAAVFPEAPVREAAAKGRAELSQYQTNCLLEFPAIYDAIIALENKGEIPEERRFFVKQLELRLQGEGLGLSEGKRAKVRALKEEIANLSMAFNRQIQEDKREIWVTYQELYGLPQPFIQSLPTQGSSYRLPCDYPTYNNVMELCKNRQVRKRFYEAFQNRGYPQNEVVIESLIFHRDALAKELGYASFAHLDLSRQMVKSEWKAEDFLSEIEARCQPIARAEYNRLIADLPTGIPLSDEKKLHAFDFPYVMNHYKKKHLHIDEWEVADYFPMDITISSLVKVYEAFFDLEITEEKGGHLWDSDLRFLSVRGGQSKNPLGYIVLDLFAREGKYPHIGHQGIIPPCLLDSGQALSSLGLVVANFPKPTKKGPTLLKHQEVTSFFHEFGHALHHILGATEMVSASGSNVQTDFVELPSQLLEEWMYEPSILRMVSSHYQTALPLPDTMINQIIASRHFSQGIQYMRQCYLARLSLEFFKEGGRKNTNMIEYKLHDQYLPYLIRTDDVHSHNAFIHLDQYGPKYYSYIWAQVFAAELFEQIQREGLLNPQAGARYCREILSKVGIQDPNVMLESYLKKKPSMDTFIKRFESVQ